MLFVVLLSLANVGWAESNRESSTDRLDNAGKVLREIMAAPDSGIPEEVLEHAKCIAEDDLDDSRNIGRPGALRFPVVETGVDEFNPSSFAQSHTSRIPFPSIRWVPCNT